MEKTAEKVWTSCLKIIKDIVEWQHYKTWFEPIHPVSLKNSVLVIQVPSQFFFEYLEEHYVNLLAKTLKREMGKDARLEYRIMKNHRNSYFFLRILLSICKTSLFFACAAKFRALPWNHGRI